MRRAAFVIVLFFSLFTLGFGDDPKPVKTLQKVFESGCLVQIEGDYNPLSRQRDIYYGCGTYINKKDKPYVLTCNHVVSRSPDFQARFRDQDILVIADQYRSNKAVPVPCRLVVASTECDFAVLEISKLPDNGRIAKVGKIDYDIGDTLAYFGKPGGGAPSRLFYEGKVSVLDQNFLGIMNDGLNIGGIGGNSGAGVFKPSDGSFVGMIQCGLDNTCQMGFVHLDNIRLHAKNKGFTQLTEILDGKFDGKIEKLVYIDELNKDKKNATQALHK